MTAMRLLLVPGLRDHVDEHWQTLLAQDVPGAHMVAPMGREDLSCRRRVQPIDDAIASIDQAVMLVAHSAGCVMVAHWAAHSPRVHRVQGALLVTPPDFETPMPPGYPRPAQLQAGGWLPVPRQRLPFKSMVALSDNDPLASPARVRALAQAWGSDLAPLGAVGHLNPASGYGPWPQALDLIHQLASA